MRHYLILESERGMEGFAPNKAVGNSVNQDKRFTDKEIREDIKWMISDLAIKELRRGGKIILRYEIRKKRKSVD